MDIEEMKKKKAELESNILKAVEKFTEETGVFVYRIDYDYVATLSVRGLDKDYINLKTEVFL